MFKFTILKILNTLRIYALCYSQLQIYFVKIGMCLLFFPFIWLLSLTHSHVLFIHIQYPEDILTVRNEILQRYYTWQKIIKF